MSGFGDYIKRQRELREITTQEVSSVTKVSLKYLNALENDFHDLLPSKPFVVGFLRVYSNYLGLDEDSVITRYISYSNERDSQLIPPDKKSKLKLKRVKFASLFLIAMALSFLIVSFL